MRYRYVAILLIVPVLLAQADGDMANKKGRARGQTSGGYALTIAGDFSGKGAASVSTDNVSLSADVTFPDGSHGVMSFSNLPLLNSRFQGATTANGRSFKIYGRVDLPSAMDDQMSSSQAFTARVIATVEDGTGRIGRLVAIQDATSRGGHDQGPGKSKDGGNSRN